MKRTLTEIEQKVLNEFATTPEEVDNQMQRFLKELKEIGVIVKEH